MSDALPPVQGSKGERSCKLLDVGSTLTSRPVV